MKRTLALVLGLMAFALMPALAQTPAGPMGKIHGKVINPTGQPQSSGAVSLSTDGGSTLKFTFPVNGQGEFAGEAAPGTYMLLYRAADTPAGKMVDSLRGIKIVADQDLAQDLDMSRPEYIKTLSAEEQKQLEELKKTNSKALEANRVITALNADLKTVNQDIKDAEVSHDPQVRTAKYTEIVELMTKDTQAKPDEGILWTDLGRGQLGLKKYADAEESYKKAVELATTSKKPSPEVIGVANAGLGEVYARQGKAAEANAAYDAAAKADPTRAAMHLRNQAIIFFQEKNGPAQVTAADMAIKADPSQAILYYIKGQGLIANSTIDPKTGKIVLPQECVDAYTKYLQLQPTGQFAGEVKGIMDQAANSGKSQPAPTGKKK